MTTQVKGRSVNVSLPTDPALLASVGRLTLAHANLDLILRMTVKTLLGTSLDEALQGTAGQTSSALRNRVRKLAKQRQVGEAILTKLDALLCRAKVLAEQRNTVVHRPWAKDGAGQAVVMTDDQHDWGPPPTTADFDKCVDGLVELARDINDARLGDGWLNEALRNARRPTWLPKTAPEGVARTSDAASDPAVRVSAHSTIGSTAIKGS